MENYNFNEENIYKIKKWKEYVDKGHFGNAVDIVNTYNEVFNGIKKPQPHTRCGSCLRRCVLTMYSALQNYEKVREQEQKLQVLEAIDEMMTNPDEPKEEIEVKKKGRPKKEKTE